ncbi:MAG: hypothetical protein JSW26_24180 [Desulfobacterales bacterium]|nr:MAG: hypothetical protein JSW26_24180 [Desulfobacterales bacterium]
MTQTIKNTDTHRDYYEAMLEKGSLVMIPHCACGNALNEDYFCEKCDRRCHCYHIVCGTPDTLNLVQRYISESSKFTVYTAGLSKKK